MSCLRFQKTASVELVERPSDMRRMKDKSKFTEEQQAFIKKLQEERKRAVHAGQELVVFAYDRLISRTFDYFPIANEYGKFSETIRGQIEYLRGQGNGEARRGLLEGEVRGIEHAHRDAEQGKEGTS